jgi:hypothetical protein
VRQSVLWYLPCILLLIGGCRSVPAQSVAPASGSVPLTAEGRLEWFAGGTVGPTSLLAGVVSSGWGTLFNAPKEYGPHWAGFGKRYGMRTAGVATGNAMEAGLGAIWGEDPRYPRAAGRPIGSRIANIMKMTVLARNDRDRIVPAYARYAAVAGSNFLSNAWRPDSEATAGDAVLRTMTGFLGRMASNAFAEFWPDVKGRISKRQSPQRP